MLLLRSVNIIITLLMINELTTANTFARPTNSPTQLINDYIKLSPTGISDKEPLQNLRCPIESIATPRNKSEANDLLQQLARYVIIRWYKDEDLFESRANGNFFDTNRDKFTLSLYQVGVSDSGTYTCDIDYGPVPPDLLNEFSTLYRGSDEYLEVHETLPDVAPIIDNPPKDFYVMRGDNVTFTCNRRTVLAHQTTHWFKSCPSTNRSEPCVKKFHATIDEANKQSNYLPLRAYLLEGDPNVDACTVENVTDDKIGFYGCAVQNDRGVTIRTGFVDLAENYAIFKVAPVTQNQHLYAGHNHDWIWFVPGIIGFSIPVAICFCLYRSKIRSDKKQTPPLLPHLGGTDTKDKDSNLRKRLPNIEAPDIYNTGKSIDGFITGHFHQEAGHVMAQSICANLLDKSNPSISSSNSHQSDEASSSWGKSSYPHGDNFRAFYSHGSNSTATTVPLYDHPPSTGTIRRCRTFVKDACVSNPSYWLLNPENDTTEWIFPRRNLHRLEKIGEGQFGEVWKYIARSKDGTGSIVAVKKLKDELCASDRERSELRAEIEIMKAVNQHPNVIKLLHCCIDECGPILLIMEYAENGKLQTYLRSCRATRKSYPDKSDILATRRQNVTSKELIKFTYHIAKGMEYVASQGIVHRDLASRNILVSGDNICKVADFGFARRVDDDCVYVRKSTNPVPVKWMAPEALEGNKFTHKSDVFSLGILMWEIVTLGATPYEQLSSEGVFKKVTAGGRLDRPAHCKDEFFALMAQCWTHEPELRPTFKEVALKLERLLLSENDYIELDQYPEHAYYNIVNAAEKEVVQL